VTRDELINKLKAAPRGRTAKAAYRRADSPIAKENIIKPKELVDAETPVGRELTLAARKTLVLMLHAAAGNVDEDALHPIERSVLRTIHRDNIEINRTLDALQTTLLRMPVQTPDGARGILVEAILASRVEQIDGVEDRRRIWFRFSEATRLLLRASERYAMLHRQTVLAFESRYSLALYELGATRYLETKAEPVFRGTVQQIRKALGVADGILNRWPDLRRRAIQQAIDEVNHLAVFGVAFREFAVKGKVEGGEFRFWIKDETERDAAMKEVLRGTRIGRRARRDGSTERVVETPEILALREALSRGELPPGRE